MIMAMSFLSLKSENNKTEKKSFEWAELLNGTLELPWTNNALNFSYYSRANSHRVWSEHFWYFFTWMALDITLLQPVANVYDFYRHHGWLNDQTRTYKLHTPEKFQATFAAGLCYHCCTHFPVARSEIFLTFTAYAFVKVVSPTVRKSSTDGTDCNIFDVNGKTCSENDETRRIR